MSTGSKRNRNRRTDNGEDRRPYRAPHNVEAQQGVLGRALHTKDGLELLATKLTPGDFFGTKHQAIADALIRTFEAGHPADPTTVADVLRRDGLLEQVGGAGELVALVGSAVAAPTAARYVDIVHDHATLRRLIESALDIAKEAGELPSDVHEMVMRSQQKLADVAANNGARTYSSLAFADVAAILAGELPLIEADFLVRSDGQALFYAGRMNYLQAEPTQGKSWLALLACTEILATGGAVLYLDYEDSPNGILGRLKALGADATAASERFCYARPEGPFGPAERLELEGRLAALNPDLIVIDGVGEALAREGADEDRNSQVIPWIESMPRWLSRSGAAVLMLDHVKKPSAGESATRYARGASAKLGAVDGAAYEVKVTSPFSRHKAGRLRLMTAKDRNGATEQGSIAAIVTIEPFADGERVVMKISPPPPEGGVTAPWSPTHLMELISREIEKAATDLTPSGIKSLFGKQKPKLVQQAIVRLEAEGYVVPTRSGSTTYLRSVRPYRAPRSDTPDHDDGDAPPDDVDDRDLSDDQLFGDHPAPSGDELAERRRRRNVDPEDTA